jgi:ABC-type nitrate/sulfonate/bicarbonate transport system ATPase subunit
MTSVISFEKVSKVYEKPTPEEALRDFNLSVEKGEFVCFIGPSGCGKSTVLKIIAGIEKISEGKVVKPENVSMVFQSGALLPWLTVSDNIALGLSTKKISKETLSVKVAEYADLIGLADYLEKYPRELSGGQRQRIGIARALAVQPKVLLLDEPFSALDVKTTDELHKDLLKIWKKTGTTIVMVSHLVEEAVALADRVVLIKNHGVAKIFPILLSRPRRENGENFEEIVREIRKKLIAD